MPIHIQSALRARELAAEAAGLQVSQNSDGVTIARNQEKAGLIPTTIHPITYFFGGQSYQTDSNSNKGKW